jgi:SAM-dependent methyltransferase
MAGDSLAPVYADIAGYYTAKVRTYGATPLGVDWTCEATQQLRFVPLLRMCRFEGPVSLNDLGCGYGAALDFLDQRHPGAPVAYCGIDLSASMIRRARRRFRGRDGVRFVQGHRCPGVADYAIASGIFNVQRDQPLPLWEAFIADTLAHLHATSRLGFAVNFMQGPATSQSQSRGLYVTAPARWAEFCAAQLGAPAEIIGDYGLREFTLRVMRASPPAA